MEVLDKVETCFAATLLRSERVCRKKLALSKARILLPSVCLCGNNVFRLSPIEKSMLQQPEKISCPAFRFFQIVRNDIVDESSHFKICCDKINLVAAVIWIDEYAFLKREAAELFDAVLKCVSSAAVSLRDVEKNHSPFSIPPWRHGKFHRRYLVLPQISFPLFCYANIGFSVPLFIRDQTAVPQRLDCGADPFSLRVGAGTLFEERRKYLDCVWRK